MTAIKSDALVFFGATGDLAYKKIFPALQGMIKHGTLNAPVIGVAKADWGIEQLQERARKSGKPIPARLPPSTPLFHVPSGLSRILDRDLAAASIPKRDERDRVVDVHALRVTLGTHLCAAGVPLRTAQAVMRHSKPELTANIYTDPKLLNVAGAIDKLPALALPPEAAATRATATGA